MANIQHRALQVFVALLLTGLASGAVIAAEQLQSNKAKPQPKTTTTTAAPEAFKTDMQAYVGLSAITANVGRVTNDPTGKASLINSVFPALDFAVKVPFSPRWAFMPGLQFTVLGQNTADDAAKRRILLLPLTALYHLRSFDLRAGPGVLFYFLNGNGGESVQRNGNSSSTFYLPSESSTARYLYVSGGFGNEIFRDFRLDLDVIYSGFLSSRGAFSGALQGTYRVL